MLAIAGDIVIVLLAAAVGAGAGWLLGRRGRHRAVVAARDDATTGTLSLADDLYARTQRLQVVEARLARAQEQLAGRSGALAAATERAEAIERAAETREREFAALEHERSRLASRVGELVAECAASTATARAARAEIDGWRARLETAEREFLALSARVAELEPMLDGLHRSEVALADAASRLSAIDSAAAERQRAFNGSQRDDLKRIPGIGPATERILHEAGVYTFRQIANWRPEDLVAITQKLGDSPARLKRDDWIAGARREHEKKYGEAP